MAHSNLFLNQTTGQAGHSFRFNIERKETCTVEQGAKGVFYPLATTTRCQNRHPVLRADMKAVGIGHDLLKHIEMVLNHTLWLSRRARRINKVRNLIWR